MRRDQHQRDSVGARVRRREDERHLHGKGRFVADYKFPDLQEVAFLRSPVAHARISRVGKPQAWADRVFVRADMPEAADIVADSSLPSYKSSAHPPLASGKVRFVGEPIAMCVAATRAEAEDIAEEVELDLDELPAFANAYAARDRQDVRVHDHWDDNLFLDLKADVDFEAHAGRAAVVVKQKVDLARQCMAPMEGKAVLAYWDHPQSQLVVITSTQVPHMIRTVLAQCLGIEQAQVRVISPDVGGAFGYKCVLQQEELCIAWLALRFKRPFRFIEDRREHLIAGANTRQHHYELTAYADETGRLLALDANLLIDGGAYSAWPFTIGLETGQALGNLPGPYDFHGYRCRTQCAATNKPGFLPYRGVARTGVCFAIELTMDAIARAVGREAWEVRHANLVKGADMPYTNVVKKHYDSGDFQESLRRAVEQIDVDKWRRRQQAGEADGRLVGFEALVRWRHPVRGLVGGLREGLGEFLRAPQGYEILLGMGGVVAELIRDTTLLLLPEDGAALTPAQVEAALRRLKTWPLLDGYRGRERADEAVQEDPHRGGERDRAAAPAESLFQRHQQYAGRGAQAGRDQQGQEDHGDDDERVLLADAPERHGGLGYTHVTYRYV